MKRKKYNVGSLYKVRFYDHSVGLEDKMICEAVGFLLKDMDEHIVLTSWRVDTEDAQIKKDNVEPCSIIKSCIISSRKYT